LLTLRLNELNNYIKSETEEKIYSEKMKDVLRKYDVYHFHYIVPEFLTPLKYIEKNKKVILTFWGSDLYQQSGNDSYRKQNEALERADYITINTPEMQESFLTKFGRDFLPKIRNAYFILNEAKFNRINFCNTPETILNFKKKYNIPLTKKIITIGYNALSKQRHIEIIKTLNSLDPEVMGKIHIVIPMTYGLQFENMDYLKEVKETCDRSEIKTTILTEYISGDELIEFTIASEIKLNLRDTDSMNAALVESLAAGNIVVNGAWLPYGKLRRMGVEYKEVENLNELKKLIPKIINNFEEEKSKVKNNYEIIRNFFSVNNLVRDWINLYDEVKSNKK
jgi:glycosyltransferase involved in cell wall biosynthesis